jgi:hypothetical protein
LRLDLLRIIALLEYVSQCHNECAAIYADIDKGIVNEGDKINKNDDGTLKTFDLSENGLFDLNTVIGLKTFGLVMRNGYENSFLMISNQNPLMLKALKDIVVSSNLRRIFPLLDRMKQLKLTLPNEDLQKAPLDNNFINIKGFDNIDTEPKKELKEIAENQVNMVYNSMTHGPLMVYFAYLEGKIDLWFKFNTEKYHDGGLIELFSELNIRIAWDPPLLTPNNELIMRYELSKKYLSLDSDKQDSIFSSVYLYNLPTKNIGGSSSQSYSIKW